jgi:hypothetical protein
LAAGFRIARRLEIDRLFIENVQDRAGGEKVERIW